MTYLQLDAVFPELKNTRKQLRSNLESDSTILGAITPFADQERASVFGVLLLRLYSSLNKKVSLPSNSESSEWNDLGVFVRDAVPVRTFLSVAGELVHVPEAFVQLYASGKPVDASITQDPTQSGNVVISQGKTNSRMPKALLLQLRKHAGIKTQPNSNSPSCPSSHSESHPTP